MLWFYNISFAGKIKIYTTNAVGLVADPEQKRPVSLINRDVYGIDI